MTNLINYLNIEYILCISQGNFGIISKFYFTIDELYLVLKMIT
jgi:hypothetical protein